MSKIIISSRLLIIATEVCPSKFVVKRPLPKVLATINVEESYDLAKSVKQNTT